MLNSELTGFFSDNNSILIWEEELNNIEKETFNEMILGSSKQKYGSKNYSTVSEAAESCQKEYKQKKSSNDNSVTSGSDYIIETGVISFTGIDKVFSVSEIMIVFDALPAEGCKLLLEYKE